MRPASLCAFTLTLLLQPFVLQMAASAQPSVPDSAQRSLEQLERRWLASEDNPDVLQTILADDFVHVLPSGFVTKEQHIAYMHSHPRNKNESRRFEDLKVRIYGSTGVANGVVITKAPGSSEVRFAFTDVFAYRNGEWQAVNAQETPMQDQSH
jgi:hypothetical protein